MFVTLFYIKYILESNTCFALHHRPFIVTVELIWSHNHSNLRFLITHRIWLRNEVCACYFHVSFMFAAVVVVFGFPLILLVSWSSLYQGVEVIVSFFLVHSLTEETSIHHGKNVNLHSPFTKYYYCYMALLYRIILCFQVEPWTFLSFNLHLYAISNGRINANTMKSDIKTRRDHSIGLTRNYMSHVYSSGVDRV